MRMQTAPESLDASTELLKAFADPVRLRLMNLLGAGEVCVCHLHEALELPQPTVSRHLAYLRRAGLVETRRDGLWVHYRFANPSDAVLKAVGDAVRHALMHMDVVHRDADRLKKKNGCCLPAPRDVAGPACCAAEPIAMHVSR